MIVLGFNCYVFNAAACIVRDGQLLAAAQQERFDRSKHSGGFPVDAIRYCLEEAGVGMQDVDVVAYHWQPFHKFHRRLAVIARNLPDSARFWGSHGNRWWSMLTVQRDLQRHFPVPRPRYRFVRVRHHLAHAGSAFLVSPFDEAAVLTVDGSGEMASSTWGVGQAERVRTIREIEFPHSLGYLYVALTHYLGFQPDSDEYKVMALASFGEPSRFERDFQDIVRLTSDGGYRLDLRYFAFQRGIRDPWVSPEFVRRFGPVRRKGEPLTQRQMDIARALQKRLEDAVLHMASHLQRRTGLRKLCYAGGTALNSVLNARLLRESAFDDVFIQPAANDAGTSIGAAFTVLHSVLGRPREFCFRNPYLGPAYSSDACAAALRSERVPFEPLASGQLIERVADALAEGKVVGWFRGRMEIGPRALGARSILADPRQAGMKDVLNDKVKHREPFRPFAPSVLAHRAADFFDCDRPSPYMLFVHRIQPDKLSVIPAVAHVDGTARIQTVTREDNPDYAALLEAFERRTGVPVLINTSFNVMGEPIVCSPQDAIRCFRSTAIDLLALEDNLAPAPGMADGRAD